MYAPRRGPAARRQQCSSSVLAKRTYEGMYEVQRYGTIWAGGRWADTTASNVDTRNEDAMRR